jgi:hypothetical protein
MFWVTTLLIALTGCMGSPLAPNSMRVSYPHTTRDAETSVQIIPDGLSSFDVVIRFGEAVTGINVNDFTITGGTVGSVVPNSDGTTWTVTINVDTASQPDNVELEFVGTISGAFGTTWSPNISATFAYQDPFPEASVSYPDTTLETGGTTQIIAPGDESFDITVTFDAPVSGFDANDITLSGGTVSSVTSNSEATIWTVTIDVDLTKQPSDLSFEITGNLQTQIGLSWTPDVTATFAYLRNYTFHERHNDSGNDWGVSRASTDTKTTVIYATDYANDLANGVLSAALEFSTDELELVGEHWDTGIPIYRGTIKIGDEVYSAEMLQLASGALSMRIFDPTDIVFAAGDTYTGSLTGNHTYSGALLATRFGGTSNRDLEGDFVLIADFTNETFTVFDGANDQDTVRLSGSGVMDSATGTFASDGRTAPSEGVWLAEYDFNDTGDLEILNAVPVAFYGNAHGDGSDISAVYYSEDYLLDGGEARFVGTLLGSE